MQNSTRTSREVSTQGEYGYLDLMYDILENGTVKTDRTGVGTRSLFGRQLRFDLSQGFPLLTTKRVFFKGVAHELIWFLQGGTNIKYLKDNGVSIWDEWADENGDLGPVYGKQWRNWENWVVPDGGDEKTADGTISHQSIDQVANLMHLLRTQPDSRRMVVSAWNPADLHAVKLAWCHILFQCNMRPLTIQQRTAIYQNVSSSSIDGISEQDTTNVLDDLSVPKYKLDLSFTMRSTDYFLGAPFNIASYALLTHVLATCTPLTIPGDLITNFGDVHLYLNHLDQAREQLSRIPRPLPRLSFIQDSNLPKLENPWDMKYEHVQLSGYDPYPAIAAPVAV